MVLVHVLRRNVVVAASLFALAGTAHADDAEVADRLTSHGGLSSSAAKKLVSKVNVRMAKAADATAGANDPMRAAVSLALFQTPQPPNSMAAAKVRLRLYAGLNEWALEAIFAPQPGVVGGCVREIGATTSECEALVAAAAKSSVAQIRSVAGGSAAPVAAPAFAGQQQAPAAAGGGRFSRFNSGYQGASQYAAPRGYPQQQQFQAAPQQYGAPRGYPQQQFQAAPQQYGAPRGYPQQQYQAAPRFQAAPQYQRPAAPAYQRPAAPAVQAYQRPAAPAYVAPAAPPAPVVSAAEQQSRKDAYKAQREAYMARKKAEFEARRQKMNSVHQADASEAPPRDGAGVPAGQSIQATAAAPTKAPAKAAPAAASDEAEEPTEAVASKASEKPALDNDFLDGLLEDPLANKKKK